MRQTLPVAIGTSIVVARALLGAQAPLSPPDLATRDQHLAQIAIEAATRTDVDAIPLRSGDRIVGAIYDQFFRGVAVVRAASAGGSPIDATTLVNSPQWRSRQMVIVALPLDCDGKPDRPLSIRFVPGVTLPVKLPDPPSAVRGNDPMVSTLLPGVRLSAEALVAPEPILPLPNARVEVDYAEPVCHGASSTATFGVVTIPGSAGRGVNALKLPEGSTDPSPTTVRMSAILDLDGKPRFMALAQGPAALAPTAMAALATIRYTPTTINGVAAPLFALVPVVFTSTGAPGTMAPPTPAPGSNSIVVTTTTPVPVAATPAPTIPMDRRESLLARLAIDTASTPAPISLDVDGSKRHGVFFGRFSMQVLAAHDAAGAGHPLDPLAPPPGFTAKSSLVVAVPIDCGHAVSPTSIEMTGDSGPVLKVSGLLSGADLLAAAPGQIWPAGAIGQLFATSGSVTGNQRVLIGYGEPACDDRNVTLTLQHDPPHLVSTPPRAAMSGPAVTVHLQGVMDASGVPRYLLAVDGPPELAAAAVASGSAWRFQPSRLNGTALPVPLTLAIVLSPASVSAPSTGPAPTMSSTVGGRLTHDTTTSDVAGLDAASSKCAIAGDDGYGTSPASPVKIGGGDMGGPPREQQYMTALRGPAGQGLHFARLGSLMGPDKTILDMYEVSYAGLAQATRIYIDEYRTETLQAPHGFTCAVPLDIK